MVEHAKARETVKVKAGSYVVGIEISYADIVANVIPHAAENVK